MIIKKIEHGYCYSGNIGKKHKIGIEKTIKECIEAFFFGEI